MRYFVTIVETGSFTQAAAQLRVAQPALSYHMAALERHFGAPLLLRNARGTVPTSSGQVLLAHAKNILKSLDEAESATREGGTSLIGDVTVGLLNSIAISLAAPLLLTCQAMLPGVRLHLVEGNSHFLRAAIEVGDCDLAINLATLMRERAKPIVEEDLYVVGRPPLVTTEEDIAFRDLLSMPLILPSRLHGLRMLLEWTALQIDAQIHPLHEVDGVVSTKATIRAGLGVSVLSRSSLQDEELAGDLKARRIVDPPLRRRLVIHRQSVRPRSRAAREVETIVLRAIDDLAREGLWTPLDRGGHPPE